jgi:hypothetical protein
MIEVLFILIFIEAICLLLFGIYLSTRRGFKYPLIGLVAVLIGLAELYAVDDLQDRLKKLESFELLEVE